MYWTSLLVFTMRCLTQGRCLACLFGLLLIIHRSQSVHIQIITEGGPSYAVESCPSGCVTCSQYNGCLTCQSTHYLMLQWRGMRQTGTCVKACPSGYVAKRRKEHGKCLKCQAADCEVCSGNTTTTCLQCVAPRYLHEGVCLDRCPTTHPHATLEGLCVDKLDCRMEPWSFWSVCSHKDNMCGYKRGFQKRTRDIIQPPSIDGKRCPITVQYRPCKPKHRLCEDLLTNKSDLSDLAILKLTGLDGISRQKWCRLLMKHIKRKDKKNLCRKNKNKNRASNKQKLPTPNMYSDIELQTNNPI